MDDSNSPQMPSLCHKSFCYLKCISGLQDAMQAVTGLAIMQQGSHSGEGFLSVQKCSWSWLEIQDACEFLKISFFVFYLDLF